MSERPITLELTEAEWDEIQSLQAENQRLKNYAKELENVVMRYNNNFEYYQPELAGSWLSIYKRACAALKRDDELRGEGGE